mmetsp:Transcript_22653/g.73662  ORF Transcript_22653/g.73662 Transcript_22653/m.73662 type:complete len:453 (+) Transcript_22653:873-2231(+)
MLIYVMFFSTSWTALFLLSKGKGHSASSASSTGSIGVRFVDLGPLENLFVLARGLVPRKVAAHSLLDDFVPRVFVPAVDADRLPERVEHLPRRGWRKEPARARRRARLRRHRVERGNGVLQAARLVHHRKRPVPHRVQLVQSARFEARGHEEDVARGGDAVRGLVREADPSAELVREGALRLLHKLFEVREAAAEHDELNILVHNLVDAFRDEVRPLLAVEAPDEADERHVRPLRERELLLERRLAHALPVHVAKGEVVRDEAVDGRVPLLHVNPVRNAVEARGAAAQHAVQQVAPLGRGDFERVVLAHRHDAVSRDRGALHQVDRLALVELVRAHVLRVHPPDRVVPVVREAELGEGGARLDALVEQVVDGEHGARVEKHAVRAVFARDEHGDQARMPVVRDEDDVVAVVEAAEREHQRSFARRVRHERVAEHVVPVRPVVVAVQPALALE